LLLLLLRELRCQPILGWLLLLRLRHLLLLHSRHGEDPVHARLWYGAGACLLLLLLLRSEAPCYGRQAGF
jgi:hypothetical protein